MEFIIGIGTAISAPVWAIVRWVVRKFRGQPLPPEPTASAQAQGGAAGASGEGPVAAANDRSTAVAIGGDVNAPVTVQASRAEEDLGSDVAWTERAGAPQFRMSPGRDGERLLCDFQVSGDTPQIGGVRARWCGQDDWVEPMKGPDGRDFRRYQMKPAPYVECAPDEIGFEVTFNMPDGPHGGRWRWPVRRHESKGHLIIDSHLGSGVFQPDDLW